MCIRDRALPETTEEQLQDPSYKYIRRVFLYLMAAIPINLIIEQKADFEATFTISGANNVALDLTNFSAEAKIKKNYTSSTSTNFAVVFLDRTAGKLKLTLDSFNTSLLKEGRYVYDIVITNSVGGAKRRVVEGQVTVTPGVT